MSTTPKSARIATAIFFFVCGALIATWVSRIPAIKEHLALNDGQLGVALLGIAVGSLISFPIAGHLILRVGSRPVMVIAGLAFCLAVLFIPIAPSLIVLTLVLFAFGATQGAMDVAMNAQGVEVERLLGRSIMASLHGMFSLGGLCGAVCGSFLAGRGWTPMAHFGVVIGGASLLIMLSAPRLLASETKPDTEEAPPIFAIPNRALLGFGIIACCAFVTEGAMADWTAVYLRDALNTSASYAAVGFAAFSLAMTVARFCGDSLIARLGMARLVSGGGLLASMGLALALATGQPLLALLGFACVGAGMASIVPVLFSAAAKVPGQASGTNIASVATMGYAGYLTGPAAIGFLTHNTTIRLALGVIILATLLIALLGHLVLRSRGDVTSTTLIPESVES